MLYLVVNAIQNWVEKNSIRELLVDDELKEMLIQLFYWYKLIEGKYSDSRLKKLTNLEASLPIIEKIGMQFYNYFIIL